MIVFECPECKAKLQVAPEHAGKTIQCPTCKTKVAAPQSSGEEAEAIKPADAPSPKSSSTGVKKGKASSAEKRDRDDDDDDDDRDDDRPRKRRDDGDSGAKAAAAAGLGIGAILLIVGGVGACCLVGVAGILIALLVPATQKVREAAARTQSMNNLKQIGLSMHSFHDVHKRLPFNGSDTQPPIGGGKYSKAAQPMNMQSGSWGFQILPFVDQAPVFNGVIRTAAIPTFMCPGRGRPPVETTNGGGAWSDYFYNNYLNDPMQANRPDAPDSRRTLMTILDGTSNTVFVGHGSIDPAQYPSSGNVPFCSNIFNGGTTGTMRAGNPGQASPTGVTLRRDSPGAPPGIGQWGGPFPVGGLFVMGDGSVRNIPYTTNVFNQMLTPAGGEAFVLP